MSKQAKVCLFLSSKFLNHSMTDIEFFHWLTATMGLMFCRMVSSIFLLIMPISLFAGLISLQGKLCSKLSLWSFNVIKASFLASISVLSSKSSFCAILFASALMLL